MSENPSAESAVAAIQALPEEERLRLFHHLGYPRDWQLGYVMVRADWFELMMEISQLHVQMVRQFKGDYVKASNDSYRRGECSRAKKGKTAALKKAIQEALQTRTPRKPREVLKALRQRDDAGDLLFHKWKGEVKERTEKTIANLLAKIE